MRAKRKAQAESVAGLLQELQTLNPDIAVISIGDYNAYQFNDGYTDPIATLKGTPTPDDQIVVDESPDLVEPELRQPDRHAAAPTSGTASSSRARRRRSITCSSTPSARSVRPALRRSRAATPISRRCPSALCRRRDPARALSDHDMPVAYFRFPPPSADLRVSIAADSSTLTAGAPITFTITVTNDGPSPAQNVDRQRLPAADARADFLHGDRRRRVRRLGEHPDGDVRDRWRPGAVAGR